MSNTPTTTPDAATSRREPLPMAPSGPCWICGGTRLRRAWCDPFDLSDFPRFAPYDHGEHPPTWLLRCDDCVTYHIVRCREEGVTREEFLEAFNVGLVVGGSITIPHLRRAVAMLDELEGMQ